MPAAACKSCSLFPRPVQPGQAPPLTSPDNKKKKRGGGAGIPPTHPPTPHSEAWVSCHSANGEGEGAITITNMACHMHHQFILFRPDQIWTGFRNQPKHTKTGMSTVPQACLYTSLGNCPFHHCQIKSPIITGLAHVLFCLQRPLILLECERFKRKPTGLFLQKLIDRPVKYTLFSALHEGNGEFRAPSRDREIRLVE